MNKNKLDGLVEVAISIFTVSLALTGVIGLLWLNFVLINLIAG